MACISKIRNVYETLTPTERVIADYILSNKESVIDSSSQSLAFKTNTSAAAWIRFAKRLGYAGITGMKVDIAKNDIDEVNFEDSLIDIEDSIDTILRKSKVNVINSLSETYDFLNLKDLKKAVAKLSEAKKIYMCGLGVSGLVCQDFVYKMGKVNREVIYNIDTQLMLLRLAHIKKDELLIINSYSGHNKIVNDLAKYAKERGAYLIAVTQYNQSTPLAKLADLCLYVPIEEAPFKVGAISSRNSMLIISDLLYFGLARLNHEQMFENMELTDSVVKGVLY